MVELAAVGCSPAIFGHQAMCLWGILCEMVSMHLGKGHHPYAVSCTFLVLFSFGQSVVWSDSAQPISWMVKSSTALFCLSGSPGHLLRHGSWPAVDMLVAIPEEQLCWLSLAQACAGRSGHTGKGFPKGQSCFAPRMGRFLISLVSGLMSPWRSEQGLNP